MKLCVKIFGNFYKFFAILFFLQIFFINIFLNSWKIFAKYSQNNWEIFFDDEKISWIRGWVDEKSFKIIINPDLEINIENSKFAIDKNSAFYLWEKIKDSEPFSFEIFWWNYSHDFRNIYFENKKIAKFSKKNFLDGKIFYLWNFYFINWDDVFLFWEKVLWDWNSFEILGDWYTKDKNYVYLNSQKIIWANPEFFKILNFWYSKDDRKIFYFWEEVFENFFYKNDLRNLDDLKILNEKYFQIWEKIFFEWEKISNDWKNFEILERNYSCDKNNLYFKNKLILANKKNLEFLPFWYLKTDFWIFFEWEKISLDTENFEILENFYAKDSENIFFNWEKVLWEDLKIFLNKNEKINYFFNDISENDKFFEAINFVKNKNIMTWYFSEEWNLFKKDEKINRAEFIKTIISAKFSEDRINLCPVDSIYFWDLPFWIWYEKFVCVAKKENLINWYLIWKLDSNWEWNFDFWWWKLINLAESLKILSKTYKFETAELKLEFKTDLWYLEYFIFAKRNNLLEWLEDVKVWDFLSRGEVARLIYNFEKFLK